MKKITKKGYATLDHKGEFLWAFEKKENTKNCANSSWSQVPCKITYLKK